MGTKTTGAARTSDGAATHPSEQVYVVQVKRDLLMPSPGEPEYSEIVEGLSAWVDVATVTVPLKTKRRTVIEKGLEQAGVEKTPELEARLLDVEAAYIWRALPPAPAALRLA